ncbi:hypothetical protein LTR62_006510 [Meristemomyces frigidus]|uniref:Uncharacterized protein n=1 Tax=Meristemomyces frigidus TaxID=1508187 RepID=A0AAN7TBI3_9PEZI|nr:hypothetical protein LTR62_006510 [Meristemomyces frigidus]
MAATTAGGGPSDPISPVDKAKPELTLSAAAINSTPVELDGESTSIVPGSAEQRRDQVVGQPSLEEREKRDKIISERKDDPAVLVDIPQTPDADEFEQAATVSVAEGVVGSGE